MIEAAWRTGARLAVPLLRWMLRRRVRAGKEIAARLPEREGIERARRPGGRLLWIHAASVGEAVSTLPLLSALACRDPALHVLFTTGTVTSARVLEQRLPPLGLDRVMHRFVPLDVPRWAARFLDHWRPDLAVFVESEIWPNLLAACRARAIPTALVNGRMSAGSFGKWRRVPGFARSLLGSFALVHAQTADYAGRLRALGAGSPIAPGNLKWAAPRLAVDPAGAARLGGLLAGRPVWLAASTHPGEEALIGAVHAALAKRHPGLLTLVAPRHPPRAAAVAQALGAPRRSEGDPPPEAGLWVVDTMGELGLFYSLAPIVFVGGSLVPHGGQNPLEPARFGCAIAAGRHTANFTDIIARLLAAGAITQVADRAGLEAFVDRMLTNDASRTALGDAAARVAGGEQALPDRIATALLRLIAP